MTSARILAPAKVNLGLSIIGKRPDGYHSIDTIMAMIDLCDEITVSAGVVSGISISGMDDVPIEANLMTKAIQLWCDAAYVQPNWHIDITKRIPSPAGIGGGSSDAAAVLKALNALHDDPLLEADLHLIASQLGADCPFFLGAPAARATGTGTTLEPLPAPTGWLVLAILAVDNSAKTSMLYRSLTPEDYGTHEEMTTIADQLRARHLPMEELPNSFLTPAGMLFPGIVELESAFREITGQCSLSGAGPALYAITDSADEASIWAEHLRAVVTDEVQVLVASFLETAPQPTTI